MLTFGLTLMSLFSVLIIVAVVRLVSKPHYPCPLFLGLMIVAYLIGGVIILLSGFIWLVEAVL